MVILKLGDFMLFRSEFVVNLILYIIDYKKVVVKQRSLVLPSAKFDTRMLVCPEYCDQLWKTHEKVHCDVLDQCKDLDILLRVLTEPCFLLRLFYYPS